MRERNGVRIGQRVRDLDGTSLGRVTALYEQGFAIRKGLPILFRSDYVARYDEVRGVRDGELVLARSRRDLFDLAAGEVGPSWRIPVPPDFPGIATPPEAAFLREDLARGAVPGEGPPPSPPAPERAPPLAVEAEPEYDERPARPPVPAPPPR
jgi:hypothetical protein